MSDSDEILGPDLAARVRLMAKEIEPPTDLWPAIAAEIAAGHAGLESLTRELARDVEPDEDLWAGIEARLGAPATSRAPRQAWRVQPWLNAAASVATVAIIAGLASFNFVTSERTDLYATRIDTPVGEDLWWLTDTIGVSLPPSGTLAGETIGALRTELTAVQQARMAIELSLNQDAENVALHTLWQQVYRTELELAGQAERIIEDYQGV